MSSNIFSETESTTSSNESRASSTSPKTPQKVYRMASNFELGDEQPENPTPRRKPFKASGNNQNLHWKLGWLTPSFGSNLAVQLKNIFFRNKTFLSFKIESWNFQHLFEIKFRETSQNFNSMSLFRQLLFSFFLSVVWLSWNFVRFHEILFQTDSESFSFLSWKTKKFYS